MEARDVLEKVKSGEISVEDACQYFRREPFEEMGYAKLDTHRKLRSGFPEVVFCSGKTQEHLLHIFNKLYEEEGEVFGTRASQEQFEFLKSRLPKVQYDPLSRILKIEEKEKQHIGKIAVCTAGTADIPVAEEAAQTAEYFGSQAERIYDVGVSGIHRLMSRLDVIPVSYTHLDVYKRQVPHVFHAPQALDLPHSGYAGSNQRHPHFLL